MSSPLKIYRFKLFTRALKRFGSNQLKHRSQRKCTIVKKIPSKDDQDDEVRLEKIILTAVFVALGIGGFILSTLWTYSTHLTLKDAKTDQTKLIIKNLLYLFIIGMQLLRIFNSFRN